MEQKRILFIIAGGVITLLLLSILLVSMALKSKSTPTQNADRITVSLTPVPQDTQTAVENYIDQSDPAEIEKEQNYYKDARPDIYLSNLTPFADEQFSVTANLEEDGLMLFTITSKNGSGADAQNAFFQWAQAQGLSPEVANTLRITLN
jgi:hypothetical protein